MKLVFLISKKEFKSYFTSPIAYLLMAFFALIFGFALYTATRDVVRMGFQAQMMGQSQPVNLNDMIIRPLLGFASTVSLFLIPMITMRLIAEEKKTGTIELLLTSPVKDIQIIVGKWLAAMLLYLCILGMSALDIGMLFAWGKPDWRPVLVAYLGLILQGGCLLAIGEFISTLRMYGYDYVISVEHEDSLLSPEEGLTKAIRFLDAIMIKEKAEAAWWV